MKIVFMGTPLFAVEVLEMLIKEHEVLCVVTQPDKKVGRKKILTPSLVKEVAIKHKIEVFQPDNIKKEYQKIIDLKPDLLISAAYGQILPKALLDQVTALNVHGSLLPKYRGGAPIQYAIFNGDAQTGVTIMYMAFKMDSGPIIKQEALEIKLDDDYLSLTKRLSTLGTKLLKEVLFDIENKNIKSLDQDESKVTFSPTLKPSDEFITFNRPTIKIINQIRGLSPEPGGYARINDSKIKIYKAQKSDIMINVDAKPGQIIMIKKKLIVKTLDDAIEILLIQAPGKKMMETKDFLNGQNIMKLDDVFKGEDTL